VCVCVCACACACEYVTCTSTNVHYVRVCEMCKRKRNKATLSWLRLVCCRHEVPVTSEPITVIHMDEDVVVVNKPASIPVSGVLPELYCQKIVCHIVQPRKHHTHAHTHTHIHTHTHTHARARTLLHVLDTFHATKSLNTRSPLARFSLSEKFHKLSLQL